MMLKNVKGFLGKYFLYSIKAMITTLYLPMIILFIVITSWASSLLATKQIEENTYKSMSDTVYQSRNYLEYMLSDAFQQIVALASDPKILSLNTNDDGEVEPEVYIAIDKQLQVIFNHMNVMLESILIQLNNGEFVLYRNSDHNIPNIVYEDFFKANEANDPYYWRNLHEDKVFNNDSNVVSVYKLVKDEQTKAKGIILFNFREDFFRQVLNKSLIDGNGYLTLISPDGHFDSKEVDGNYQLDDETIQYLQNINQRAGELSFENASGETMIAFYDTIGVNKWKIVSIVPYKEILNRVSDIKYVTVTIIIIMSITAIFLSHFIGKFISDPFKRLVKQMEEMEKGNFQLDLNMSGPEEMKILHKGFREHYNRINSLMFQIRLEQEEKRQLEFAVMHAQINPHFLYNTLYSIKGLCDMGLNEDASKMITSLSSFFRIGISKGKEIITIKDEIEHIRHYLYIQEMRYGDDFCYEIQVEQQILCYNIIKLSLQPLLENAIYHGVKQKRGQGRISIKGFEKNDVIYLEVADNGNGIEKDKLKAIKREIRSVYGQRKQFIGIGLQSVNERVKIHFGREYGISIDSILGEGTKITITIPKTRGEIRGYE